jgi:KipI family sensor histidine kinase inhibitor
MTNLKPRFVPLGDRALLVRFGDSLDEAANRAAIGFAGRLADTRPEGVEEVTPNLVSVLLGFDPRRTTADRVAAELRLLAPDAWNAPVGDAGTHTIRVSFDGEDLAEVAGLLKLEVQAFIARHNAASIKVLATGFAPGFVYCGFHPEALHVPRRTAVRTSVPAGTVVFAAGQTAIAATAIPTGWHVIGHTAFRNFDPSADPPTTLRPGDRIVFEAAA